MKNNFFKIQILVFLLLGFSYITNAEESKKLPSIDVTKLELEIGKRISLVQEFRFVREQAQKMGVHVWLFGGTAAGFAHYVKWDLLREGGDKRFQPDRFDYDYTNIYRSTQDLDIVADGTPEQIDQLSNILSEKYPFFLGSKTKWEVRSLRDSKGSAGTPGYKEALLNDYDFLNQNSDSNSTGMIEVSQSHEPVVRDLRDWQSPLSQFLKDVGSGKLHFYRSHLHQATSRYKVGENPEIFAVVRALTKMFQYELEPDPESLREIQNIIDQFDPTTLTNPGAIRRLKEIGIKLFKHAVNIEYAWNNLEQMGLRRKLMHYDDLGVENSLAWWMNKEPLRSHPVGLGGGKTAIEIAKGLGQEKLIVAHETKNFLAYESITRAQTGDPNVFISRATESGEMAAFGNGFYTQIGRNGATGSGLTIRFAVEDNARDGTDFVLHEDLHDKYLIFLNKNALKVIPESLNMGPLEYFEYLAKENSFDWSDKAIIEKLKRRLSRETRNLSLNEEESIFKIVKAAVLDDLDSQKNYSEKKRKHSVLISEFFTLPFADKYVDQLLPLIQSAISLDIKSEVAEDILITEFFKLPSAVKYVDQLHPIIVQGWWGFVDRLVDVLAQPSMIKDPKWPLLVDAIISRRLSWDPVRNQILAQSIVRKILSIPEVILNPHWVGWMEKIISLGTRTQRFLGRRNVDFDITAWILDKPEAIKDPHWDQFMSTIVSRLSGPKKDIDLVTNPLFRILSDPLVIKKPEWRLYVKTMIEKGFGSSIVKDVLSKSEAMENSNWSQLVLMVVSKGDADKDVASMLEKHSELARLSIWPQFVDMIVARGNPNSNIEKILGSSDAIRQPHWAQWMNAVAAKASSDTDMQAIRDILSQPEAINNPNYIQIVQEFTQFQNASFYIARDILGRPDIISKAGWASVVESIITKHNFDTYVRGSNYTVRNVLSQPDAIRNPQWFRLIQRMLETTSPSQDSSIDEFIFSQSQVREHPEILRVTNGVPPTARLLRTFFNAKSQKAKNKSTMEFRASFCQKWLANIGLRVLWNK
jgi:hypothetical protein